MLTRWILLVSLGIVAGCGKAEDTRSVPTTRAVEPDARTPGLKRVRIDVLPDWIPESPNQPIAVSGGYTVYRHTRQQQDTVLTMLDSTGALVRRFARRGHGPGELVNVSELRFQGRHAIVLDLDQARLLTYDRAGKVASEFRIPVEFRLVGISPDSLDWMNRVGGGRAELRRGPGDHAGSRVLLTSSDSFLQTVTSGNRMAGQDIPPYATSGGLLAIADPMQYAIRYYGADGSLRREFGRDLEPRRRTARELERDSERIRSLMKGGFKGPNGAVAITGLEARLDSLKSTPLPHFYRHGLGFDERGRLWVVGESNDSTFADVFADTTFLTRIMIPCLQPRGSVSLNGHWLALMCTVEDGGDYDAELQLYRIVEANGRDADSPAPRDSVAP